MRLFALLVLLALAIPGCTVLKETLVPHSDLKSPCACAEDAVPVNDADDVARLLKGVA